MRTLYEALKREEPVVKVPGEIAEKARAPIVRMLEMTR